MHRRLQRHSNEALCNFDTGVDSFRSASAKFEPLAKNSSSGAAKRPPISPEIPETPAAVLETVRRERADSSGNGNTAFYVAIGHQD